jgi:carboxypeptidase C (cathepsin A)
MPEETAEKKPELIPLDTDKDPVVTEHHLGELEYTATTGMLPIRNKLGETEAGIFFVAYTKKGCEPGTRPLMFSFNGGPGSSSVWLHLGALGPKRVRMEADGQIPPPPYEVEDNPHSWLEHVDLVFIDPVGTGFSRPAKPELGEKFWGLKGDIESVGEFIRLYLTRYQRWASPLYLVGESYGTTRAAGLSGHLIGKGIAFRGIVLVSSVLTFQTLDFTPGNDQPYVLFLPTYAATAHYQGAIPKRRNFRSFLKEVEAFANGEYLSALHQGDGLPRAARKRVITKLKAYTGLSEDYLEATDLRIHIHKFCKELLRKKKLTVGRLDSRFTGVDKDATGDTSDNDPSMSAIFPPYTMALNDYLRRTLKYENDAPYHILGGEEDLWKKWNWGSAREGHPDTSESLRSAMAKNPHMKVFIASGYYDLATPYFATYYTLDHMGLTPDQRKRITTDEYEAGHMMYIHEGMLEKLKSDIAKFLR